MSTSLVENPEKQRTTLEAVELIALAVANMKPDSGKEPFKGILAKNTKNADEFISFLFRTENISLDERRKLKQRLDLDELDMIRYCTYQEVIHALAFVLLGDVILLPNV